MAKNNQRHEHIIAGVEPDSIAEELGFEPGDVLLTINGNEIIDFVDYSYFCCSEEITLKVRTKDGEQVELTVEKDENDSLGLSFENDFMDRERPCRNKCVFCFIDQMPKELRKTLYFKDDDWRLSLLMGNYVTLTNVDDAELNRIISRRVSPLYISVHATDKNVRAKMLGRGNCHILPALKRLAENNLLFHCQIVLCPGFNDGKVLERTLSDLYGLGECCGSVAVVPVGITKFREGLCELKKVDRIIARNTLDIIEGFRSRALKERGRRFVFASDEIYITGEREFPSYEEYEGFDQIEDGIGMYAMFAHDFKEALSDVADNYRDAGVICGTLIAEKMQELLNLLPQKGALAMAVENQFFGSSITVTGLLTGRDILQHIKEKGGPRRLYLSQNCLRRGEDVFLDGMTLEELKENLPEHTIEVVCSGYDLAEKMRKN